MKVRFSALASLTVSPISASATIPDLPIERPPRAGSQGAPYAPRRLQTVNRKIREICGRSVQQEAREGQARMRGAQHDRVAQAKAGNTEQLVEIGQQHVGLHPLRRIRRVRDRTKLDLSKH